MKNPSIDVESTDFGLFDPEDDWLEAASEEEQIAAMRRWFLARYEDPANQTPWDSEDKKYVFVWGGPYNPDEEIQSRFGDVVDTGTMWELITEFLRDVGDQWAPIYHEGLEYDDYVSHLVVMDRGDPFLFLGERIGEIFSVLAAEIWMG